MEQYDRQLNFKLFQTSQNTTQLNFDCKISAVLAIQPQHALLVHDRRSNPR